MKLTPPYQELKFPDWLVQKGLGRFVLMTYEQEQLIVQAQKRIIKQFSGNPFRIIDLQSVDIQEFDKCFDELKQGFFLWKTSTNC